MHPKKWLHVHLSMPILFVHPPLYDVEMEDEVIQEVGEDTTR